MFARCAVLSRLLRLGLLSGAVASCGCHFSDWMNRSVINPPEGFSPTGNAYYSAPASATVPVTNLPTSGGNTINLSPTASPPLNTTGQTGPTGPNTPRDTYNVAARVPQDSQPIQVVERTTTPNTMMVVNGMTVNDGTQARAWGSNGATNSGNFGQIQPNSQVGINVATLRGTGTAASGNATQSFSQQDGQWKSRSSYEATERR